MVLSDGSWPYSRPSSEFNIAPELRTIHDRFSSFYDKQHSGRKLSWLYSQSKGEELLVLNLFSTTTHLVINVCLLRCSLELAIVQFQPWSCCVYYICGSCHLITITYCVLNHVHCPSLFKFDCAKVIESTIR